MLYLVLVLAALCSAQQVGTNAAENHPSLTTSMCTKSGGCTPSQDSVVLDHNWRWLHKVGDYVNCYTGNEWDTSICPDADTCAKNCALDGADYTGTYGVHANGDALKLDFVTTDSYGTNVGSRTYLMNSPTSYKMFKLKNKEFTFDVDVSNMPCGLNGALYFVAMDPDGGMAEEPNNNAGAKYGTGYCDAQCPRDLKFIKGQANVAGWVSNPSDPNAGTGNWGSCCDELDIWEGNQMSNAYTPHPCSSDGPYRCDMTQGTTCGDGADRYNGVCDKDGCDLNPFRIGNHNFFGEGSTVDSSKKVTVVTQFITADGTDEGDLSEIRRYYVQDGKVIGTPESTVGGRNYDSITDSFCDDQKRAFGDNNDFSKKGGLKTMGEALSRGMVLVMSIWADFEAHMLWLDSNYPTTADPSKPGVARGTCPTSGGDPNDLIKNHPDSYVTYSNIKFGELNSTFSGDTPGGDCPGGSLSACINLCPSNPPAAYQACVESCVTRCT